MGIDAGRSGKTALFLLAGTSDWRARMIHLSAIADITGPEIESAVTKVCAQFSPHIMVMESEGPGGVLADYIIKNNSNLPIFTVDTSQPASEIFLWNDIRLSDKDIYNIRAEMYWIVHLLLRDGRLKFPYEDVELWSQLTSTRWDLDIRKNEKIILQSKRHMKIDYQASELEGYNFSRSPDKADAAALAVLGYAVLMQQEHGSSEGEQEEEIVDPIVDGIFDIGRAGLEEI